MTKSETITEITKALISFHKEVSPVKRTASNPFFKSKYAPLSEILKEIHEPLVNNGLTILQFPEDENNLTTMLIHDSGEYFMATYSMKPVKSDPQATGSAITYQRRYAIGAILNLNIDDDDDGNKAAEKPNKKDTLTPNHPKWVDVLNAVKSGKATINQVREKFTLSADNEKLIQS